MKVAQNDETNPNTRSVRPLHIPSIANMQQSPFRSFVQKRETPGILSRIFSPSPVARSTELGHPLHRVLPCSVLWCFDCSVIYCVRPPLLLCSRPRDPYRYPSDRLHRRWTLLLTKQPGKPPPLDHQISPILLYTACISVVKHVTAFR